MERHDTTFQWSTFNTDLGPWTIEENKRIADNKTHEFNVSNVPLFPKIPLTNVVVDNLHMFLHVSDLLIDMVIGELRALDKVNQSLQVCSTEGLTHLASYETALKSIGISGFSFWVGENSSSGEL